MLLEINLYFTECGQCISSIFHLIISCSMQIPERERDLILVDAEHSLLLELAHDLVREYLCVLVLFELNECKDEALVEKLNSIFAKDSLISD